MKASEHLHKLIIQLSNASLEDYNSILKTFDFDGIDLLPFQSWSAKKYTRNCLHRDADFELILLCWEEGQETSIHGHDGEDCWVYLLNGAMEEVLYTMNDEHELCHESTHSIATNQLTFMNDKIGYHKLKNTNPGRSMSLHLYAKPIDHCRFFDENSKQFIQKTLTFDTFKHFALED